MWSKQCHRTCSLFQGEKCSLNIQSLVCHILRSCFEGRVHACWIWWEIFITERKWDQEYKIIDLYCCLIFTLSRQSPLQGGQHQAPGWWARRHCLSWAQETAAGRGVGWPLPPPGQCVGLGLNPTSWLVWWQPCAFPPVLPRRGARRQDPAIYKHSRVALKGLKNLCTKVW